MNLPDYCAEGREIQLRRMRYKWVIAVPQVHNKATTSARHNYRDACTDWHMHRQKCDQCGGK
jgi:hypothetical protein